MPGFNVIFIISIVIFVAMFVFVLLFMLSPKMRGKLMSNQIKAMRHMTDYSKDDLESMMSNLGQVSVDTKKKILDNNEDNLKDIADRTANIHKDAIKTTVSAIKDGIKDTKYCKYCGEIIDKDSKYCKECGKVQ